MAGGVEKGGVMEPVELVTQSFIIKIWSDEQNGMAEQRVWQGEITHVMTGETYSLENIADIKTFMMPFLQELADEESTAWFAKL